MDKPQTYLTSEDLAEILHVSVKTIYNRLSLVKRDETKTLDLLPKPSNLPSLKGARWSPQVVARWQAKYEPQEAEERRRPGRPTKAEQIARRLSQSVANVSGQAGK